MKQKTPNLSTRGSLAAARNSNTINHLQAFIDAMTAAGVEPSDPYDIDGDGVFRRFHVVGDKPGTKNGYAVLYLDNLPAGFFGDWKRGIAQSWSAKAVSRMTARELKFMNRRRERMAEERAFEIRLEQNQVAEKAAYLWGQARPAKNHAYLERKAVKPYCARTLGDSLALPIVNIQGQLMSLQFIAPDGQKRFLTGGQKKGCFILVNDPENATKIVICEGFATGATLAENMPDATVISALDAGNLLPVAEAIRKKHPAAEIVIACDFDEVGQKKGHEAARAIGGLVLPVPENLPPGCTDWNDFAELKRKEVQHDRA